MGHIIRAHAVWRGLLQGLLVLSAVGPMTAQGQPLLQCAKDLYACGKGAVLTQIKTVEAAAGVLGFIVAHPQCVAAMTSGNPVGIGVTGLVVGLGSAGVVQAGSCEAQVYGVAAQPVAEGVDALLGTSYQSQVQSAGTTAARALLEGVVVPGAVPPSVGGLLSCGCGALAAGASAIEDIKEVGKFASQTYQSCSAATKSCPGLSHALSAAGWLGAQVVKGITNPSSIVQDCDSMSRGQYHAARMRPLITGFVQTLVDQNIPWSGSFSEGDLNGALDTCKRYYDSHCMTESEARDFCHGPVFDQNTDPELWAAVGARLNAQVFPKYFHDESAQYTKLAACPAVNTVIYIDPNQAGGQAGVDQLLRENAQQCQGTMQALLTGEKDSLRSLTLDMLPTTREGWADVRFKPAEPAVDNAKKVYRRLITAAAVVIKPKIAERLAYYVARDKEIRAEGAKLVRPAQILAQSYRGWAENMVKLNTPKCPAGNKGWGGKFDLPCVQDLASTLGFQAVAAYSTKGSPEFPSVSYGDALQVATFQGVPPFDKASEVYYAAVKSTGASNDAGYSAAWKPASDAARALVDTLVPALMVKHANRVAGELARRTRQDETLDGLGQMIDLAEKERLPWCNTAPTPTAECRAGVQKVAADERASYKEQRADMLKRVTGEGQPWADAYMTSSVATINRRHDTAITAYDRLLGARRGQSSRGAGSTGGAGGAAQGGLDRSRSLDLSAPSAPGTSSDTKTGPDAGAAAAGTGGRAAAPGGTPALPTGIQPRIDSSAVLPPAGRGVAAGGTVAAVPGATAVPGLPGAPAIGGAPQRSFGLPSVPGLQRQRSVAESVAATTPPAVPQRLPQNVVPAVTGEPAGARNPATAAAAVADTPSTIGARASVTPVITPSAVPPTVPAVIDTTPRGAAGVAALPGAGAITATTPATGVPQVVPQVTPQVAPQIAAQVPQVPGLRAPQVLAEPAFNEAQYRQSRLPELAAPWGPRCTQPRCRDTIESLLRQRLDEEVTEIRRNTQLLASPPLMAAMRQRLDARYTPQLEAAVRPPTPSAVRPPPDTLPPTTPSTLPRGLPRNL